MSGQGLTPGERAFTGTCFVFALGGLFHAGLWFFMLKPDEGRSPGLFWVMVGASLAASVCLTVCSALTLIEAELKPAPTNIQCSLLFLTVVLIPVALWGQRLLSIRDSTERESAQESAEPQLSSAQRAYLVLSALAGVVLLLIGVTYSGVVGDLQPDDARHFISFLMLLYGITLIVTTAYCLRSNRLLLEAMIPNIVILALSVYGIPLAVFGCVVVRRQSAPSGD